MKETIIISDQVGRIDAIFAEKFPDISRSQWTKSGEFFLLGKKKVPGTKVKSGQEWEAIYKSPEVSSDLIPWDFPLKILKETDDYVVIEKPIGVSVHPSGSEKTDQTIVNALIHQFGLGHLSENEDEQDGIKIARPGIVHRLDKPTSGVLLIAKNNKTHKFFTDNWPRVEKYYSAIVTGTPPDKANIEGALVRDPKNRKRMTVMNSDSSRNAQTSFHVTERGQHYALLSVQIFTGRTHQIRVHLASVGFPILGDELYGGKKYNRIMLHAHRLIFPDPKTGEMTEVEAPIPPGFYEPKFVG